MYCRSCAKQIPDQAVVCVGCGVPVNSGKSFCQTCGAQTFSDAVICTRCGVPLLSAPLPGAKSKVVAGLLGLLLGGLGVHRFYLGFIGIGIAQVAVTLLTCGAGWIWGFIEGILLLTGTMNRDADGNLLTN